MLNPEGIVIKIEPFKWVFSQKRKLFLKRNDLYLLQPKSKLLHSENKKIEEKELVRLLKAGSLDGVAYLYDNYAAALYGVISRIISDEAVAQDTLQEVFVKIWSKIDQYDDKKGRLFTWMLNIARNASLDVVNSARFKNTAKNQSLELSVYQIAGSETKIDGIGLKELVDDLKEDQQKVIDLIYFHGYTHQEVADELELPLGTVKTRVRSALKLLRKVFAK